MPSRRGFFQEAGRKLPLFHSGKIHFGKRFSITGRRQLSWEDEKEETRSFLSARLPLSTEKGKASLSHGQGKSASVLSRAMKSFSD